MSDTSRAEIRPLVVVVDSLLGPREMLGEVPVRFAVDRPLVEVNVAV